MLSQRSSVSVTDLPALSVAVPTAWLTNRVEPWSPLLRFRPECALLDTVRSNRFQAVSASLDLPLIASGKVRDNYELDGRILMVASDRISTYDAVHPTPIPGKGQVLTGMSVFWFELTSAIVPNHLRSEERR